MTALPTAGSITGIEMPSGPPGSESEEGHHVSMVLDKDEVPSGSVVEPNETWGKTLCRLFCKCSSSSRVPLVGRYEMDPVRKWYHYNVFPRTVLLHLALIVTVTTQIVLVNEATSSFSQNVHNSWIQWLFPSAFDDYYTGSPLTFAQDEFFLYRTDLLNDSFATLFTTYFGMDKYGSPVIDIVEVYDGLRTPNGLPPPSIEFTSSLAFNDLVATVSSAAAAYQHSATTEIFRVDGLAQHLSTPHVTQPKVHKARRQGGKRPQHRRNSYGDIGAEPLAQSMPWKAPTIPDLPSSQTRNVTCCNFKLLGEEGTINTYSVEIHDISDYYAWASTFFANLAAIAAFTQNVLTLDVNLAMKTYNTQYLQLSSGVCLQWQVVIQYGLSAHGVLNVQTQDQFNTCQEGWQSASPLLFLAAFIVLLAILQQFTITRTCLRNWRIIQWVSILSQAAKYNARQMRIKRMLATANRIARLELARQMVAARQESGDSAKLETDSQPMSPVTQAGPRDTPGGTSAGLLFGGDTSQAQQGHRSTRKKALDVTPKYPTVESALAAGAIRLPPVRYPCEEGLLDTGIIPLLRAVCGCDRPDRSILKYYDHLAGPEDSDGSDDDEDGSSSSCSSEFNVSSDSDVEDPTLVYLGIRQQTRKRRSSGSSSASSSSSSSSASEALSFSDSEHSSTSSSSGNSKGRRAFPVRSLAQQAARFRIAIGKRAEANKQVLHPPPRRSSTKPEIPPIARVGRSASTVTPRELAPVTRLMRSASTASASRAVRFAVDSPELPLPPGPHPTPVVKPTEPTEAVAEQPLGPGTEGKHTSAKIFSFKVDWAAPSMVATETTPRPSNRPLLTAVHNIRHAAHHVSPHQILELVDPWFFISTLANIFNIIYACLSLVVGEASVPGAGRLLLGLAAALDWITLMQYLKYNGNYYLFIRTFWTSGPAVFRNILSGLPMFGAFVVFAVLLVGNLTERFSGLPFSSITFFAVANGDIVRETFQMSLYYQVGFIFQAISQVMMYVFCCLFIYCLLRTTLAINEQSYVFVRPLPPGLKAGARADDIPDMLGEADTSPLAYKLPTSIRRLLVAMQKIRDYGGALHPIVVSAASSVPGRVQYLWNCCSWLTCGICARGVKSCYDVFCCWFGSDWRLPPDPTPELPLTRQQLVNKGGRSRSHSLDRGRRTAGRPKSG